jgi:translation initiation factor 2 subunit 1
MIPKKKGYPEEGDCVFCTVTNVQYNSVFVSLDEYERKSGMIHISEVSPGRIRNINDYVKEGKVIVCKVLNINKERGHIDLSLRRVNESQRRAKIEERKQEGIAENILKSYVKLYQGDVDALYSKLSLAIKDSYDSVYLAFEDVVEDGLDLTTFGLDKEFVTQLNEIIKERIKPKQVTIEGEITLTSYESNGVEVINSIMKELLTINNEKICFTFLGGGRFKFIIIAPEYKEAESYVLAIEKILKKTCNTNTTSYAFERD